MLFRINLNTIFTPIYTLVFPSGIRTLIVGVRVFNVTRSSDFKSSWKKKILSKIAQIFADFLGKFEMQNCFAIFLGNFWGNWATFCLYIGSH